MRKLLWICSYPFLSRIRALEDIHRGEECYIFGDGCSLQNFDLSVFSDRVAIAVATFPRHRQAGAVNLRYWVLAEPFLLTPPFAKGGFLSRRDRARHYRLYRRRSSDDPSMVRVVHITNLPVELGSCSEYFFDHLPSQRNKDLWKSRQDFFSGSINSALSLAIYLGFKRAYLVGFDYTHAPPISGHWYEDTYVELSDTSMLEYKKDFFSWAQQFIEIVTVVPNPQVTALDSIDYESLTGAKPRHYENSELATSEDLGLLSLWPGYNISKNRRNV